MYPTAIRKSFPAKELQKWIKMNKNQGYILVPATAKQTLHIKTPQS